LVYCPPMSDQGTQDALGRWLRRQLEHGITVSEDVLDYLASTFGTRDLAAVAADADASEADSLLEMLFYPDSHLLLKFEARWGRESFSGRNREAIIDALCSHPPTAHLDLPDAGSPLDLPVPAFACRAFVERLHICRGLHPDLDDILEAHPKSGDLLMIRVRLRHARLKWHDDQVALMGKFLNRMPASSQTFLTDLEFLISILPEMSGGDDGHTFLTGKKLFYFKALCGAEAFERKRAAGNMEILMLSGARSAHGNIEEWRQLMRRIDRICKALYGRTKHFQPPDGRHFDLP
jgi:hypothetical protein